MKVVCLDLEGVLVPEIWIEFAKITKIEELKKTTRDISDYNVLMDYRMKYLNEYGLTLKDIQDVIAKMEPLEGALEFLNTLRDKTQVIILSDTFSEFALPLMRKLSYPTIFCNSLVINDKGMLEGIKLRQVDGKRKAVEHLKQMGFKVFAAGDSYNDLSMIKTADKSCLFRAPKKIIEEEKDLKLVTEYSDFLALIEEFLQDE